MPAPDEKTVAIVGAGPGGLIAAQKLLRTHSLHVTVFDKAARVGGLWERNNLINPQMQTNFCQFTIAFSDLDWESVKLGDTGRMAPMYPRAWMVEAYLEEFKRRFLGEAVWRLGTKVVRAERAKNGETGRDGIGKAWKLSVQSDEKEEVEHFDYLVVATGYLSQPKALDCEIDDALLHDGPVPIMHSTQFRKIEQLYASNQGKRPQMRQKVLVVGGSHSGSEISTLVAFQASNARWAPGAGRSPAPELDILHITNHPMLAVPGFTRDPAAPSCAFQPLEYFVYERATRPPEPLSHTFGLTNPEESMGTRKMIETFVNGEASVAEQSEVPAYAVVSENYTQFVESKVIKPYIGQLKRLSAGSRAGELAAVVTANGNEMKFDGITAVINATGFDSCGSLSFLSDEIKTELGFDDSSIRLPLILDTSYMAQRHSVPDIAVLGFTGVNWGVMEMQCRAIARKWTSKSKFSLSPAEDADSREVAAHIETLREAIKNNRKSEIPQVLFGDYLGLMELGSRELELDRVDMEFGEFTGMVCPARYTDRGCDKTEAQKTIKRLRDVQVRARGENLYLARAVFHGLSGKWLSKARTTDGNDNLNEIVFHPRHPTSVRFEFEYLVIESSKRTVGGISKQDRETRSVFRYDEVNDEISVWSARVSDRLSADELTFKARFDCNNRNSDPNSCFAVMVPSAPSSRGTAEVRRYTFRFQGSHLKGFDIDHTLDGGLQHGEIYRRPIVDIPTVQDAEEFSLMAKFEEKPVAQVTTLTLNNKEGGKGGSSFKGNCCERFNRLEIP